MAHITIKCAETGKERQEAQTIRREIFVKEQNMFAQSDQDENDAKAETLIALINGEVAGTVRVFSENGNGNWVGGRLAVKREYRGTRAGTLLVHGAVRLIEEKKANRFTAHIQLENVGFFEKLGWKVIGPAFDYRGLAHMPMEKPLNRNGDACQPADSSPPGNGSPC